jgi:hypothetical protein
MAAEDSQRCAWRPCGRPVERPATGRPGRYCGSNCRQSAYRERVRQADAERDRAARLAAAKAEAARLWRPLEAAGFADLPEVAAAVVAYASDPADTRAGLADVLYRLRAATARLEELALGYRDAIDTAARLAPGVAVVKSPGHLVS